VKVCILSVPYDSGRYRARMGLGPERLWGLGLKPLLCSLGHQLVAEEILISDAHPAEIKLAFALCGKVAERVQAYRSEGYFPVVLSGNCNTAVGTISGCDCRSIGVVWFDAHGESTTPETTTSGFLDGMGLAMLTGQCWQNLALSIPEFEPVSGTRILLVDARDVEAQELALLDRVGVTRVAAIGNFEAHLKSLARDVDGVYLHVDLDVLDRTVAVANHWASSGGLSIQALMEAVAAIQAHTKIRGLGIASYDPECDQDQRALTAACSIVKLVVQGSSA
jgi:arginase